jgi:Kelch motif
LERWRLCLLFVLLGSVPAMPHSVFAVPEATGLTAVAALQAEVGATRFATLPEAASSFGAVASDGWLYIYGGHTAPTHRYSTESVSGRFSRLNLSDGATWQSLPAGPPLQGVSLVSYHGQIYRIGGMQPRNQPGEPEDVRSVAGAARFDPGTGQWQQLPSLPEPRSSHDVVVVGDQLVVVGGWTLKGKKGTEWPATMEVLDLAAATLRWRSIPQPIKRRALVAAALDGKIYVIGGFNQRSQVERGVKVYDVRSGEWADGPMLPGDAMSGFGPAACTLDGNLYVSLDDGGLYRLDVAGATWTRVGHATPRIVHRLAPAGERILVVGGAAHGANSDLIEAISVGKP